MLRVVVVEDDAQLRGALTASLRGMGIEILAQSGDGLEALDALTDLHPDLILTDCQMPRLDGISLVRRLRQRGDETPVIMISGQDDPQVQRVALEAGVTRYLRKPLSVGSLNLALIQTFPGTAA